MNKEYFTEFYHTNIDNPDTCDTDYIVYHGIIYVYRKSWIRRRLKRKVLFHVSCPYRNYLPTNVAAEIEKAVQARVEEALKVLKSK